MDRRLPTNTWNQLADQLSRGFPGALYDFGTLIYPVGNVETPREGPMGNGATKIEHLGFIIDSCTFRYYVKNAKLEKLHGMANALIQTASKCKRWVRESLLRSFAGTAIS